MEKRFFKHLFMLCLFGTISIITRAADISNNEIWYEASSKLAETTSTYSSGLHINTFNTTLRSHTFNNGKGIITFNDDVTSIGDYAFYGCKGLTSVTIGNSVTSIGSSAFSGCTSLPIIDNIRYADTYLIEVVNKSLSTYKIKQGTKWIRNSAFSECSGLTSVSIPNSVISIGTYNFEFCSKLTSITVESDNKIYDSRDNCNAIIETASNTLITGCSSTTIPNTVIKIGDRAFISCKGLTSVTIPNFVTSIGKSAFAGCSGLTSVTIGNSVTSIGDGAFASCLGLTSVTIPNSVKSIGSSAFSSCYGLESITIPNSVTSIGKYAFSDCKGLASVTIGNSVTSIDDQTFGYCSGLTSVTIGKSVNSIHEDAFYDCDKVKELIYTEGTEIVLKTGLTSITSVTIPNSVTEIENYAFSGCKGLTSVTIPNSVTSIGDGAFSGCSGLTSVTIPNSVTSIGDGAFNNCSNLKSVYVEWKDADKIPTLPSGSAQYGVFPYSTCDLYVPAGTKEIYQGKTYWRNFKNIIEETVSCTSVSLNEENKTLSVGETLTLTATVLPEDATDKSVTWSSDNESVATVADGVVTAVAVGTANITAKTNDGSNLSATCVVTVTSKETPSEDIEPSTDISKFTNVLYINDVEARQGTELSLPLNMKNAEEDITAFECKVYLPEGVEWASTIDNRGNKIFVQPTFNEERTDANYHTINSIKQMEDGGYYVIVYSDKKEIILDKDGAILYMPLTVSEEIEPADYNIFVKDIVIVNENTEQVLIDKTVSKLTVPSYTIGDANDDGMINITDVVAVISYMLKESPNPFIFKAADVNCDEMINVTDVVGIIDIMTSGASSAKPEMAMAKKAVKKSAKTGNSLEIVPFTVAAGTTSMNVALELNNPGDEFTALECKVFLPEGVDWDYTIDRRGNKIYKQPTFNEDRTDANYHTINSISKVDGGYYVIVYSDKKEIFLDEDGALLYLPLVFDENINPGVYDIRVGDIVLARPDVTQELLDDYTASVLVGSPEIASLSLNGDFTADAIAEYNTALASNTKVAAMDFSNATDIDASTAITTGNKNFLVYVAEGKSVKNESNAVIGNACANLVLTDGYSFCAPKAFTAAKASYTRTATNTHGTLCLPFAPTSVAGDLYELTSSTETSLTFSPVITPEANVPYLYYCENDKVEASNVAVGTEGAGSVTSGDWTMTGTYEPQVFSASDNAFAMFEGKLYKNTGTLTMNPFRAYFTTTGSAAKADIFVETPTGIENISAGSIEDNGRMYNLQGIMVNKNYQGMKIVNGKKYIK